MIGLNTIDPSFFFFFFHFGRNREVDIPVARLLLEKTVKVGTDDAT